MKSKALIAILILSLILVNIGVVSAAIRSPFDFIQNGLRKIGGELFRSEDAKVGALRFVVFWIIFLFVFGVIHYAGTTHPWAQGYIPYFLAGALALLAIFGIPREAYLFLARLYAAFFVLGFLIAIIAGQLFLFYSMLGGGGRARWAVVFVIQVVVLVALYMLQGYLATLNMPVYLLFTEKYLRKLYGDNS
ncbi:hypothetical protein KY330_02500 [Candidatus Woesearchaeota archaeon]|nr:hypothetical protein [Candidatus Woesearchaeota archaeon]